MDEFYATPGSPDDLVKKWTIVLPGCNTVDRASHTNACGWKSIQQIFDNRMNIVKGERHYHTDVAKVKHVVSKIFEFVEFGKLPDMA